MELRVEILERCVSSSAEAAIVRWRWLLLKQGRTEVLNLVATAVFETSLGGRRNGSAIADQRMAYTVAEAAAAVEMSRYVLYDAIRAEALPAYRHQQGGDLRVLPEDLGAWITRYKATLKGTARGK